MNRKHLATACDVLCDTMEAGLFGFLHTVLFPVFMVRLFYNTCCAVWWWARNPELKWSEVFWYSNVSCDHFGAPQYHCIWRLADKEVTSKEKDQWYRLFQIIERKERHET